MSRVPTKLNAIKNFMALLKFSKIVSWGAFRDLAYKIYSFLISNFIPKDITTYMVYWNGFLFLRNISLMSYASW